MKQLNPPITFGASDVVSMTSLEIAGLLGKNHNNVLRDIKDMLNEVDKTLLIENTEVFTEIEVDLSKSDVISTTLKKYGFVLMSEKDSSGKSNKYYLLDKIMT